MQVPHRLDPDRIVEHLPRLYRAARAWTGSREEAEDLVQETCARVLARPRARAGLDLSVPHSVLTESPASSTLLERDLLPLLKDGIHELGFALQLACKDLRLALELADSVGVPVELSAVERVLQQARADYGDTAGEMTPVRLCEDRAGTKLRAA